jgi:outer membrane receptor protein involved in Fe transport
LLLTHCYVIFAQVPTNTVHISGFVLDANESPVAGADVVLKTDQQFLIRTLTDQKGRFELSVDNKSDLSLEITSPGFAPTKLRLDQPTQGPLRIVLVPQSISAAVTVTATRTATRLAETAANVVQLNQTNLQTTSAVTLDDALRQVAGFSLFRRSGSRTANPTSQGVSLRATGASGASRALVLADGVPLNDPFGGWIYWDRVPRESISQVEVLLGSASHLYGNAALGGVVDITTRPLTTNTLSFSASYGNETSPNASLFAGGTKDGWSGSIAAETFRTDGYVLVPNDQRGIVDTAAGTRDSVINVRGERKLSEAARFFGTASFFGESRENGTPLQTNRTHLRQFVVGGSWQSEVFGSFTLRSHGGTQTYDQNFSAISVDRNSETLTRVQRVPAQVFGASAQWSRTLGKYQTLVAGFEGREVRGASDEIASVNGRATSFIGAGGRERSEGGYFEDLLRVNSRLFINLGGRVDHWRNFAAAFASRPISATNPTSVLRFPDRTESAFSPHGSVAYRLTDRVSLMASMSRAFRAPTLNELYRSFRVGNVSTLANENLKAERLAGGEAGVRIASANDKLTLRGNFFWNDITRPVANVTLSTTPALITRQRQNLGRTRSGGVELQAEAQVTQHWNVSGSYLFADATVIEFPASTALEGLRLPQVPRQQFTFQTRYANSSLVTAGLQGRASSSQFDDDQNQFRLGSYFTLDAFVSRRVNHRLEVFGAVENLFNQRYEVGKTPITTLGPPILVRAGFRVQLGAR